MTSELLRRALATGFAAALLLGGASCGEDEEPGDFVEDPDIDEGLGGTDDPDGGFDTGEGLGGTDDDDGVGDLGDPNEPGEELDE